MRWLVCGEKGGARDGEAGLRMERLLLSRHHGREFRGFEIARVIYSLRCCPVRVVWAVIIYSLIVIAHCRCLRSPVWCWDFSVRRGDCRGLLCELYNSDWERWGGEEDLRGSVNRNPLSSPELPSSPGRQLQWRSLLGSFLPLDLLFCGWTLLLLNCSYFYFSLHLVAYLYYMFVILCLYYFIWDCFHYMGHLVWVCLFWVGFFSSTNKNENAESSY